MGHRGSNADGGVVPILGRKSLVPGPGTPQGTETSEVPDRNIIITPSPENTQPETGKEFVYLQVSEI